MEVVARARAGLVEAATPPMPHDALAGQADRAAGRGDPHDEVELLLVVEERLVEQARTERGLDVVEDRRSRYHVDAMVADRAAGAGEGAYLAVGQHRRDGVRR